jgi:hypothetical protein
MTVSAVGTTTAMSATLMNSAASPSLSAIVRWRYGSANRTIAPVAARKQSRDATSQMKLR